MFLRVVIREVGGSTGSDLGGLIFAGADTDGGSGESGELLEDREDIGLGQFKGL